MGHQVGYDEVEGLIRSWLARYDSNQTQGAYRNDFIRWMRWCDEHRVPVLAVSGYQVGEYRRSEPCELLSNGDKASASTVSRRLASLSSFYRYCVAAGVLEQNPVDHLRLNRSVSRATVTPLSPADTQRLLDAAASCGMREFAIISLQVVDGLRARELLTLNRADIDLDQNGPAIYVRRADGRVDDVGIAAETARALAAMLEGEPEGWLLHTNAGQPVRRQYVYQVVRRMARRAGIATTVSCQCLHQTFLSACDAAHRGRSLVAVSEIRSIDPAVDRHPVIELPAMAHRTRLPAASAS